ncbi:MAG: tail fiber domain-containing protein, partial [Pseudomonadales bacterium]|nr:tail fiber domain-containing protein [Pseudomonadales bacterium]
MKKLNCGHYNFELTVIPNIKANGNTDRNNLSIQNNGPKTQAGSFMVKNGMIVSRNITEPKTEVTTATPEGLDGIMASVVTTDQVVQGSLCVGVDCTSSESFGFDTIRLKENNLRIKFDDTSASASFPKNDWMLVANDSSNGGAEYFAIEDVTNSKVPFKVEANTPSNALYVDSADRIGLGTSTPVVDLHIKDGNSPTVRLEQDGSDGFTPQTWDISGNEANFFIRDVTNSSKLPFRIKPGAGDDAIFIGSSGQVGFGLETPDSTYKIHAYKSGDHARIVAERGSAAKAAIVGHSSAALFGSLNDFPTRIMVNGSNKAEFFSDNSVSFTNGATINTSGQFVDASTRELKENISEIDTETAMKAFAKLRPVTYNYKAQKDELVTGFIAEEVPELVAQNGRKGLAPLEITALLTRVVKE